jgi:uncharacterized protein (TIGR02246 family)
MLRLFTILSLTLGLLTPTVAENISEEEGRQAVEGIIQSYVKAMQKHDADGLAALYTKDALIVRPAGPISGIAEITHFYQDVVKIVIDLAVDIETVKVLGDGVILANGVAQNTMKGPDGSPQKGPKTYWVQNAVRQNGVWKIRMLASSSTGFNAPAEKRDQ